MTERPTFCQEIRGIACDDCELRTIGEAFWRANAKDTPYYTAQQLKDALHDVRANDAPDDPSLAAAGYLNKFNREVAALLPDEQAVISVDGTLSVGEQSAYLEDPPVTYPTSPEAQMIFNCFARNQQEGCASQDITVA